MLPHEFCTFAPFDLYGLLKCYCMQGKMLAAKEKAKKDAAKAEKKRALEEEDHGRFFVWVECSLCVK